MTPQDVDSTGFLDLLHLMIGIDARHKARKDAAEKGVWIP